MHCNTLQHAAVHCNTLQQTATPCNTLRHNAPFPRKTTCRVPSNGRNNHTHKRHTGSTLQQNTTHCLIPLEDHLPSAGAEQITATHSHLRRVARRVQCARARKRARARERARMHTHTAYTHLHTHAHTYTLTHTHTHLHSHAYTHAHTQTRTHTHTQT